MNKIRYFLPKKNNLLLTEDQPLAINTEKPITKKELVEQQREEQARLDAVVKEATQSEQQEDGTWDLTEEQAAELHALSQTTVDALGLDYEKIGDEELFYRVVNQDRHPRFRQAIDSTVLVPLRAVEGMLELTEEEARYFML